MAFVFYLIFVSFVFVRPFEILMPEVAEYSPMIYIAIGAILAGAPEFFKNRGRVASILSIGCLAGFACSIAISWVTKGWMGGALSSLLAVSPAMIAFILTVVIVNTSRRLMVTVVVICTSVMVTLTLSILDYHFGFMDGLFVLNQKVYEQDNLVIAEDALRRIRGSGELKDPNDLAQALLLVLPFFLAIRRNREYVYNKLFALLPIAMILYGLYLTHSRGALMGMAAILSVPIYKRYGKVSALIFFPLMIVGLIVIGGGGGREFSSTESSASGRLDAWSAGINMLKEHVLFGVGYGDFTGRHGLTAHNSYVLAFSELGLLGYFFWMGLIVLASLELSNGFRTKDYQDVSRSLLVAFVQSMAAFLVAAFFLSRSYSISFFLVTALCICAGCISHMHDKNHGAISAARWLWLTLACVFGSIFSIYFVLILNNYIAK